MGLDVGTKTIGVAISDPLLRQSSPLLTITRRKVSLDMAELAKLAAERQAVGFVIGLPLNMNGSEGPMVAKVRLFARQMLEASALFAAEPQISFYDERLSTAAMEDFLIEANVSRKRRDGVIDKLAAHTILQAALDSLHS